MGYIAASEISSETELFCSFSKECKCENFFSIYFKAFGVGAFENDDANIYTNYDISQYDFAIGGVETASDASCSASNFVLIQLIFVSNKILLLTSRVGTTTSKSENQWTFQYFSIIIAGGTSFLMASKRQLVRHFFEAPRIPSNFVPRHTPIHPDISQMPLNIKHFSEKMNHLQRAKFLGEVIFLLQNF